MLVLERGTFSIFPALQCKGLHPYQQIIFIWLCYHANNDGICFPSLTTLADECGISRRSVIEYLNKLEKIGYIVKSNRCNGANYASNTYKIVIKSMTPSAPPAPLVQEAHHPSAGGAPPLVQEVHSNQKNIKLKSLNQNICVEIKETFDQCWKEYPQRGGTNPKKTALEQYMNRFHGGETFENLLQATKQYKKLCDKLDQTGTAFVMQGQRFYGSNELYKDFINMTDDAIFHMRKDPKQPRPLTPAEQEEQDNLAYQQYLKSKEENE
jgi:hypothetical protein